MILILNIGDVFGRLIVIEKDTDEITKSGYKYSKWICLCSCGNLKSVRESYLVNGYTKSCGCLNHESRKLYKHHKGNEYEVKDNVVYVKLSNSEDIMMCDVDIWDDAKNYTWSLDDHGYASARINHKTVRFHRHYFATYRGSIIDHIDRNKLNNLKNNIREAGYLENNRNVNMNKNNTSGYRGVSYDKERHKFYAYINIMPHKRKFLGYYNTAEEANRARLEAEKIYY